MIQNLMVYGIRTWACLVNSGKASLSRCHFSCGKKEAAVWEKEFIMGIHCLTVGETRTVKFGRERVNLEIRERANNGPESLCK